VNETRDRSRDILVRDIKTGEYIVDNRDKYFAVYMNYCNTPGTREFLQLQQERSERYAST
jgi:hypothetical protein